MLWCLRSCTFGNRQTNRFRSGWMVYSELPVYVWLIKQWHSWWLDLVTRTGLGLQIYINIPNAFFTFMFGSTKGCAKSCIPLTECNIGAKNSTIWCNLHKNCKTCKARLTWAYCFAMYQNFGSFFACSLFQLPQLMITKRWQGCKSNQFWTKKHIHIVALSTHATSSYQVLWSFSFIVFIKSQWFFFYFRNSRVFYMAFSSHKITSQLDAVKQPLETWEKSFKKQKYYFEWIDMSVTGANYNIELQKMNW